MAVILPLATYGGAVGLVFAAQRRILYPAPQPVRTPEIPRSTLVRLPAVAGGPEVVALYVPPPDGKGRVLVHFHDTRQQLADLAPLATTAGERHLGYFAVEYPGYGIAPGRPSEAALYQAADQALAYLQGTLGAAPDNVVLLGDGIGGGVAIEMALRGKGMRVIVLSSFTSLADVAVRVIRWMPIRMMLRDHFENARKAAVIPIPALIVHGGKDEVFPFDLGQKLSEQFKAGRFLAVPEAGHFDLLRTGDTTSEVLAFATAP